MTVPFGVRLRELRESYGWTQVELSKRSGVERSLIAKLETEEGRRLSAVVLRRLADAFGLTMDTLVEGTSLGESVLSKGRRPLFCV